MNSAIFATSATHVAQGAGVFIPWWAWVLFFALVTVVLALDLGVFHKADKAVIGFKEAAAWCGVWVTLAAAFGGGVALTLGTETAGVFAGGYLLELALSVDNLFVFLLVFSTFQIPEEFRHRVLFWGIIGAVLMRAAFISGGSALVQRFDWILLLFGVFLVFTGVKMLFPEGAKHPENGIIVNLAKKVLPVTSELDGHRFFTRDKTGRHLVTRLFLVLLIIEATDVVFAVDSIPAVIGILPKGMSFSEKLFVMFTSNIFAVLGLRSLFFALSGFMGMFRFLKHGLVTILVFIGAKMIITEGAETFFDKEVHISTTLSLTFVGSVLLLTIIASLVLPEKNRGTP